MQELTPSAVDKSQYVRCTMHGVRVQYSLRLAPCGLSRLRQHYISTHYGRPVYLMLAVGTENSRTSTAVLLLSMLWAMMYFITCDTRPLACHLFCKCPFRTRKKPLILCLFTYCNKVTARQPLLSHLSHCVSNCNQCHALKGY